MIDTPPSPPSIADLVRRLIDESAQLLRAEWRLAQSEASARVRDAIGAGIAIIIGAVFLLAALFTLLAAMIGWLAVKFGAGNAALIVTVVALAIGGGLVSLGLLRLKKFRLASHAEDSLEGAQPEEKQP